jgi:putative transposase
MITTAQKIMLIVDKKTASTLNRACGCARYAYNWARDTWFAKKKAGQKSVTCAELRKEFNEQKTDWMYESPKGSMDQAIKNFVLAKQRHYENPDQFGFPKRKKYKSKRSFYIENDKAHFVDEYHIKLPKIPIPVRLAEPVRLECLSGKINNFVVSKGINDRWYISISYTFDDADSLYGTGENGLVGIDMGVKTLMQLSTGEQVANDKLLRQHSKRLKRYQRMMSRRKYNSVHYKDIKKTFNKKNAYIKNFRKDLIHKATTEIVKHNMVVAIENLNVKGMMSNHKLASAISDCGFGMIRRFLEYKSDKYGTLLLRVGRFFPSSKKCSGCGHVKEKLSLSEREYICEECGLVIDRDTNAAINILAEALFNEINNRFNTDIARRKFTPADLVALASSLSGTGETTEVDAHCLLTRDGRAAMVDEFFNRLWNQVANATINCI